MAARERPAAAVGQGRTADLGHGRLPGGAQDPDPSRLRGHLYVYGRTRGERYIDTCGAPASRRRVVTRPQDWQVLLVDHHPGYISWDTYLANTARLAANMAPVRGAAGTGATREGGALLQGLAICGVCGRRLGAFYRGPAKSVPGYQCNGGVLVGGGQGRFCTRASGLRIDPAVAGHVLEALTPLALQAALDAADHAEAGHDAALDQWRRQAEQARYAATRAERRYRAVDPENRLVARGLEAEWEATLQAVREADAELDRRNKARPVQLSPGELRRSSPSALIFPRCGRRRPPPTATARNSCTHCWTTWSSPSMTRPAPPASWCTGKAAVRVWSSTVTITSSSRACRSSLRSRSVVDGAAHSAGKISAESEDRHAFAGLTGLTRRANFPRFSAGISS